MSWHVKATLDDGTIIDAPEFVYEINKQKHKVIDLTLSYDNNLRAKVELGPDQHLILIKRGKRTLSIIDGALIHGGVEYNYIVGWDSPKGSRVILMLKEDGTFIMRDHDSAAVR